MWGSSKQRECMAIAVFMGLALAAALTGKAQEPRVQPAHEPKVEGDLKAMQGEWVSSGRDATQVSHWSIEGNRLALKTPTRKYKMVIELVPSKDPEKAINFRVADDSQSSPGSFVRGIYKFAENDVLKVCVADKEGQRPTEFKADPGGTSGETARIFVFELKRPKK